MLSARRERVARALGLRDEVVLVGAGEAIGIPGGQDQTYPFLAHGEYVYLTDRQTEGGVVALDPGEGWTDFVPTVSASQRVWEGLEQAPGTPIESLAGWLAARRGRPVVMLGTPLEGVRADWARTAEVRERFTHARRAKDAAEIDRMRAAARATAAGHARARELVRQGGVSEHEIRAEIESAFLRAGGTRTCYGTIVGAGSNAAVLHFEPGDRRVREGEMVLIDAAAEVRRYGVDVTRTVGCGAVSGARAELHAIVRRAMERAIARCVVGAEWVDVHVSAALDMAEGLVAMGVLRGSASAAVERGAMGLFFPHGLGHLVGIGARDATGRLPGRGPTRRAGVVTIRCDFPLEAGYSMTVEPGCYFIGPLLNDASRRAAHKDAVAWDVVDRLLGEGIGGVRLEDTIVVTPTGPENLTGSIEVGL